MTEDEIKVTPLERVTSEVDLMGLIDCSIRTTLIFSDEAGFNIVKELFSGFNLNHTISNIVLYDEENTVETETLYEEDHEI